MKRVCAWCGLGVDLTEELTATSDQVVTHGICASCLRNAQAQAGIGLGAYLDTLEVPILVMDAAGVVRFANRPACALLGKESDRIEGVLGGDVFECENARRPGGCGRTVHCSGCAIRQCVLETLATSISHVAVPATISPDCGEEIGMTISTERFGDFVLLRIDELKRWRDGAGTGCC